MPLKCIKFMFISWMKWPSNNSKFKATCMRMISDSQCSPRENRREKKTTRKKSEQYIFYEIEIVRDNGMCCGVVTGHNGLMMLTMVTSNIVQFCNAQKNWIYLNSQRRIKCINVNICKYKHKYKLSISMASSNEDYSERERDKLTRPILYYDANRSKRKANDVNQCTLIYNASTNKKKYIYP